MRYPDVLLVVLDCLRADATHPDGPIGAKMPTLEGLQREGTWYSRAIASSHWTVPSHASILTGLDPWDHRTFRGSTLHLPREVTAYAEVFRRAGYRTLCYSANPFISPLTDLCRGFDLSAWGQFSDCFRRFQARPAPVGRTGTSVGRDSRAGGWVDLDLPDAMRDSLRRLSTRFPLPLEAFSQAHRLSREVLHRRQFPAVAGWIEDELAQCLSSTPKDQPVFAVVNLLEAHEPYFGVLATGTGALSEWLWAYSGPLDRTGWREGLEPPSARDVARITRLYRAAAESADRRLASILATFGTARSIEMTDVVVMGDHGQAIGEQGQMYHVHGTYNAGLGVPLIIKPGSHSGRGRVDRWVSIAESLRLLGAESEGVAQILPNSGGPRISVRSDPGSSVAAALVDGPPASVAASHTRGSVSGRRPPTRAIAVYFDSERLVLDISTGRAEVAPADSESGGQFTLPKDLTGVNRTVYDYAKQIADRVTECLSQGDTAVDEQRLASWGY